MPAAFEQSDIPGRLDAIARLVDATARVVADVGYDHGLLILRLVRARPELRVIGVEPQEACDRRFQSRRAASLDEGQRVRISLRRGSGLAPLEASELDTIVMAGMGERTMLGILEAEPERSARIRRLILCPGTNRAILRPALAESGWRVEDELIARERGRLYPVVAFARGDEVARDDAEIFFGARLLARRDPALRLYLEELRAKLGAETFAACAVGDERRSAEGLLFARMVRAIGPALGRF